MQPQKWSRGLVQTENPNGEEMVPSGVIVGARHGCWTICWSWFSPQQSLEFTENGLNRTFSFNSSELHMLKSISEHTLHGNASAEEHSRSQYVSQQDIICFEVWSTVGIFVALVNTLKISTLCSDRLRNVTQCCTCCNIRLFLVLSALGSLLAHFTMKMSNISYSHCVDVVFTHYCIWRLKRYLITYPLHNNTQRLL